MPPRARGIVGPWLALVVGLLVADPWPVAAQRDDARGGASARVQIGVTAGGLSHSVLGTVTGRLFDVSGMDLNVNVAVEAERAVIVGGLLGLRLSRSFSLSARFATASTHIRLVALASPLDGSGFQRFTFEGLGKPIGAEG